MAKKYRLIGHFPGKFTVGNLGEFDSTKLDEKTAQMLIKAGVPLEEYGKPAPTVAPAAPSN